MLVLVFSAAAATATAAKQQLEQKPHCEIEHQLHAVKSRGCCLWIIGRGGSTKTNNRRKKNERKTKVKVEVKCAKELCHSV